MSNQTEIKQQREFIEAIENLRLTDERIQILMEERSQILSLIQSEINKAEQRFNRADQIIETAISRTGVNEATIPTFLHVLNDELLGSIVRMHRYSFAEVFKVFKDLIERHCQTKLSIEMYFTDNCLERFIPILEQEDFKFMEDLLCDDNEEYEELKEIVDNGLEAADDEKESSKKRRMSVRESKLFKKFCYRTTAEKSWIPEQKKKENFTKRSMLEISSVLAKFFGMMYEAMNEVGQILNHNAQLNESQTKAIQIEEKENDTIAISETEKDLPYMIGVTEKLRVTNKIGTEFQNKQSASLFSTVANVVESCCIDIAFSHSEVQQYTLLARDLLKYKPAKTTSESEPLWNAITCSITNMFKYIREMSNVSATYCSYFLKFKHSFERFIAMHEIDNDVSLSVAMEYLIKDVDEFDIFQKEVALKLNESNEMTMLTIQNCVMVTFGGHHFEEAIQVREEAKKKMNEENRKHKDNQFRWQKSNLEELKQKQAQLRVKIRAIEFEKQSKK